MEYSAKFNYRRVYDVFLLLFFFSVIAKVFFGLAIGFPYRLFTVFQVFLVFLVSIFLLYQKKINAKNVSLLISFLLYHFCRYMVEIYHLIYDSVGVGEIFSVTFSFVRVLVLAGLYVIWLTVCLDDKSLRISINIFFVLLIFTVIYSIFQNPVYSPFSDLLVDVAGNVTSRNQFGIYRSSGGLGGTVILYADYIILTAFLFLFGGKKLQYRQLWLVMILMATYLSFSRVTIVSLVFMIMYYFFKKKAHVFVLGVISLILVLLLNVDFSMWVYDLYDVYQQISEYSDTARIDGWNRMFYNLNPISVLLGYEVGANLGFFAFSEATKLSGDGFIFSWIYEYGLIGLFLLLLLLYKVVVNSVYKNYHNMSFLVVLTFLFVNNGFEKFFLIIYFFLVFMYLKSSDVMCCERSD